jgi:hypothetical protein
VSNVYIDAAALLGPRGTTSSPRALVAAARTCGHLRDLGHRVILVGRRGTGSEAPDDARGWLVSGDADACDRARRARRLHTVLVGPSEAGRTAMDRPADIVARDLGAAVLSILAAEAMPAS